MAKKNVEVVETATKTNHKPLSAGHFAKKIAQVLIDGDEVAIATVEACVEQYAKAVVAGEITADTLAGLAISYDVLEEAMPFSAALPAPKALAEGIDPNSQIGKMVLGRINSAAKPNPNAGRPSQYRARALAAAAAACLVDGVKPSFVGNQIGSALTVLANSGKVNVADLKLAAKKAVIELANAIPSTTGIGAEASALFFPTDATVAAAPKKVQRLSL